METFRLCEKLPQKRKSRPQDKRNANTDRSGRSISSSGVSEVSSVSCSSSLPSYVRENESSQKKKKGKSKKKETEKSSETKDKVITVFNCSQHSVHSCFTYSPLL